MICDTQSDHPKVSLHKIPEGYRGTLTTAQHIATLVKQGAKDFCVRQTAIDILLQSNVQPKDYIGEINALFQWVQRNIRYTKDTAHVEVLHSARRMLELRAGDCDDFAILLGQCCNRLGIPYGVRLPDPTRSSQDFSVTFTWKCSARVDGSRWISRCPMRWAGRLGHWSKRLSTSIGGRRCWLTIWSSRA